MAEEETVDLSPRTVKEFDSVLVQEEHGLTSSAHSEEHGYKAEGVNCDNSHPSPDSVR